MIWLVLFGIFALVNWRAARLGPSGQDTEYIVKPAATAALLLYALAASQSQPVLGFTTTAGSNQLSFWLIAALTASLLGDVYLMLPGNFFIAGLVAFLLA